MKDNQLIITLFGATGDLAARKLYPAFYRLYKNNYISKHFALIGTARREWSDAYLREVVLKSIADDIDDQAHAEEFVSHFYYQSNNVNDAEHYITLKDLADKLDAKYNIGGNRIFYISLSPKLFPVITGNLKSQNLLTDTGYNRLIIEKPFGYDYKTAEKLQAQLNESFSENQIYRIDHYLGKEILTTIPSLRFNNIFNDLWNKDHIDNVQITLTEDLGVGPRGVYYETSGVTRDMIQNHALQMLAHIAMPQPVDGSDDAFREAKKQVLENLHLYNSVGELDENVVRGQYGASEDGSKPAYREEDKVAEHSITETYFAANISVNLPEWEGVPFFIRSGKRLKNKATKINIIFKNNQWINRLEIETSPDNGYRLYVNQKQPGYSEEMESIPLEYFYSDEALAEMPNDYEYLIHDCIIGSLNRFTHWDEVASTWKYIDNVHHLWGQMPDPDFPNYPALSSGPKESDDMLARHNTKWY